jgi:hypothetical protein
MPPHPRRTCASRARDGARARTITTATAAIATMCALSGPARIAHECSNTTTAVHSPRAAALLVVPPRRDQALRGLAVPLARPDSGRREGHRRLRRRRRHGLLLRAAGRVHPPRSSPRQVSQVRLYCSALLFVVDLLLCFALLCSPLKSPQVVGRRTRARQVRLYCSALLFVVAVARLC